MKWQLKDINMYLQSKEYVDTAIIPLVPVTWHDQMLTDVSAGEFTNILSAELENQLKGRIVLLPPFTYLKSEVMAGREERITNWLDLLKADGIEHIHLLTSDVDWKTAQVSFSDQIIWMPAIPLGDMDENHKLSVLEDQVKQLLQIVTNKWQNDNNFK